MSGWGRIYRRLASDGTLKDSAELYSGTAWLEPLWPLLDPPEGDALDLGCGLGSDMVRYAERGWQPVGLEREPVAAETVYRHYGFPAVLSDLAEPFPFRDGHFDLITARCSLHFVPPSRSKRLFSEIHRILRPGGRFLFIVNSTEHLRRRMQYDYSGAVEKEPNYWHLPAIGRSYFFYDEQLAREHLSEGWEILQLGESKFSQWGIPKRVVLAVARRDADS